MQGPFSQPFLVGAFISLCVAVPIGPVALACINRTLACGLAPGVASGLGVATVHFLFGIVGLSSFGAAAEILGLNHAGFEFAGSTIVIVLAVRGFLRANRPGDAGEGGSTGAICSAYATTGLLALSNPLTIIGLTASFTMFGLSGSNCVWQVATGMFCGSALWWTLLCSVIAVFRAWLSPGTMIWMSRSANVWMGCLGVLCMFRKVW